MNIVASIQARMGSSRLPGKVLKKICGKPMLQWQVDRIRRSRLVDQVVVATTTNPKDDEIAEFCKENDICCHRGSEVNVLNRIALLIQRNNIDVHVEFYGDSPLPDAQIIDEFIGYYLKLLPEYDCVSSAVETSYPPGQEVIVYRGDILVELDELLRNGDPLREHVAYNITRYPDRYNVASIKAPAWYRQPEMYLEVDTEKDFKMMKELIGYFCNKKQEYFTLLEVISLLKDFPEISRINNNEERLWKTFRKSKV